MDNKTKRHSKQATTSQKLFASLFLFLFLVVFGFYFLLFSIYKLDRILTIRMISKDLYNDALFVYEDAGRYNGNINIVKRYYWVDAEISLVTEYYNQLLPPMVRSEDEYGYWMTTLYNSKDYSLYDESLKNVTTTIGHSTFCLPFTSKDCITLSLVDITQENYYRISTLSPDFRWSELPFNTPSDEGTLIIYTFYD